jgi:hypothetical protein
MKLAPIAIATATAAIAFVNRAEGIASNCPADWPVGDEPDGNVDEGATGSVGAGIKVGFVPLHRNPACSSDDG